MAGIAFYLQLLSFTLAIEVNLLACVNSNTLNEFILGKKKKISVPFIDHSYLRQFYNSEKMVYVEPIPQCLLETE